MTVKKINTAMISEDHATYSASGSKRWINCPASIRLSEGIPDSPSSVYAEEGTRAHEVLEAILKNHNGNLLTVVNNLRKNKKYNEEMIDHALDAYKYIRKVLSRFDAPILQAERKVDASPFTMSDQFGTLDVSIFEDFGSLYIMDYKYGAGIPVEPNGPQLIYYALAVCYEYDFNFSDVTLVIIQPRAEHEKGPIREFKMSVKDLMKWEKTFKDAVKECQKPDCKTNAGEWCRYCKAAFKCPEIGKKSMANARIVFDPIKDNKLPVVEKLTTDHIAKILDNASNLKTWISEVERRAYALLQKGNKIDGYKLVERRGTRKWIDYDKALRIATKNYGDKILTKQELLSPAQFEKIVKNKKFTNQFSACISSGLTLTKVDDERSEQNIFDEITD
jgi:hypothetical protein